MESDSNAAVSCGHKIADTIQEPSHLALGLWFMYPTPILSIEEYTVPITGLPNPKSNSATGNLPPDDTTSAGPSLPNTTLDSINPGLWHSIQSIKSKKQVLAASLYMKRQYDKGVSARCWLVAYLLSPPSCT